MPVSPPDRATYILRLLAITQQQLERVNNRLLKLSNRRKRRIAQALARGASVKQISAVAMVPEGVAYRIIREAEEEGLIDRYRRAEKGYATTLRKYQEPKPSQ